jgi:hypothetical protein
MLERFATATRRRSATVARVRLSSLASSCNSSAATSGLSMMASLIGLYFDESGKLAVA